MTGRGAWVLAGMIAIGGVPPSCKKLMRADADPNAAPNPAPTLTTTAMAAPTATIAMPAPSDTTLAGDALLSLGTAEWISYQPEGARFAVFLPQKPQETVTALHWPGGQAPARQATASRVGALYTLFWCDLPTTFRGDAKAALDAARDDAIRAVPTAALRLEREIKLGKNPGREFQAESSAPFPLTITAHAYLVGRRIYEQIITVPSSVGEGGYVDKFMTSLAVANEGTGVAISDDDANAQPAPTAPPPASASASASKPTKKKK